MVGFLTVVCFSENVILRVSSAGDKLRLLLFNFRSLNFYNFRDACLETNREIHALKGSPGKIILVIYWRNFQLL